MPDRSKHKKHPPINKNHLKKQMREHIDSRIYSIQKHKAFSPLLELYDVVKVAGEVASAAEATGWVIAEAGPEADPIALAWWIVTGLIIIACLILALQVYFVVIIIKSVISNIPAAGGGLAKAVNPLLQWLEGVLRGMGDTLIEEALAFGATIAAFVHAMAALYDYQPYSVTQTRIIKIIKIYTVQIHSNGRAISNLWSEVYGGQDAKHHHVKGLSNTLTETRVSLDHLWFKFNHLKLPGPGKLTLPKWIITDIHTLTSDYASLHTKTIPHIEAQIKTIEGELTDTSGKADPKTKAAITKLKTDLTSLYHEVRHNVEPSVSSLTAKYVGLNTHIIPHIETQIKTIEDELSGVSGKVDPKTKAVITHIRSDLNQLYHEVRHNVEQSVARIEAELGQPHGKITVTIMQELANIKGELKQTHAEYEDIRTRIGRVETRLDDLHIPGKVDTKAIWANIHHLQHQTSWMTSLAPFLQLLPLTATEIGNLNKLKDKPCQCPSRAGADNDDMLWAAIAENIAANGM